MLALLVGIVAVPITSTALFLQQDAVQTLTNTDAETLRDMALSDRSRLRAQRRLYWRAIEQSQREEDFERPDFNDPSSYERVYGSAPETDDQEQVTEVTSLTTDQLETHDRSLLRRYTRAGFCPDGLKNFYISGFYELCKALVGSNVKDTVKGLLNDKAYLRQQLKGSAPNEEVSQFKLRMQMIDEAKNGYRRDPGQVPMRPTECVMNPDCLEPTYSN